MSSSIKDDNSFVWPNERDFIARPERYKYVRQLIKPQGCVFCAARDEGVKSESLCLYQKRGAMVVINKYPYNSGHILVLPQKHIGDLTEMSAEELANLNSVLMDAVKIIKNEYECAGLNIGMNHGQVAGAGIPDHLHWHIIPRWTGDTNFFPLVAETKVLPETVEQTYDRLYPHFKELS